MPAPLRSGPDVPAPPVSIGRPQASYATFADDRMRARAGYAAHNLAALRKLTLNLIRLDPIPHKGGIKVCRLIAAALVDYRAHFLGLG